MIGNTNESLQPSEYTNVPKYIGVASVNIKAINPDNTKLRSLGYNIPENAEEPRYIYETTGENNVVHKSARIRFMCEIQEFADKPIIPLDFWIREEIWMNKDNTKCQIIDQYGRTAWATQDDVKGGKIPVYSTGEAKISTPYKPAHKGEEELVRFLMKYLCCTPYEVMDRTTNTYILSQNPGKLTIDDWKSLINGNVNEIKGYVATRPDNLVKVILGVRHSDDNKTYQVFINDKFMANNNKLIGDIYPTAQTIINKVIGDGYHDGHQYSSTVVRPYEITPTKTVKEEPFVTINEDMPDFKNDKNKDDNMLW